MRIFSILWAAFVAGLYVCVLDLAECMLDLAEYRLDLAVLDSTINDDQEPNTLNYCNVNFTDPYEGIYAFVHQVYKKVYILRLKCTERLSARADVSEKCLQGVFPSKNQNC